MKYRSKEFANPKDTIATVSQFVARIADIKKEQIAQGNKSNLLFRGQPCDKPLLPKLGRMPPKGKRSRVERLLLNKEADKPFYRETL